MQPNCNPIPVPKLVADDMLEVGAMSHVIGRLSSFHFAGPRPIHIQELVMALAAVSLIRPPSLTCDSAFVCRQKISSLP